MNQKPSYTPSRKKLERYAHLLVNFALGGEEGIKKDDVVRITIGEEAKPLLFELRRAITQAGGHAIINYLPSPVDKRSLSREFYEIASDAQLTYYPEKYVKGMVDTIDHNLYIISDSDPHELQAVDPRRLIMSQQPHAKTRKLLSKKENAGKFTWCGALYGTEGLANEAGLSLREYWKQIERACFLDKTDPVAEFKSLFKSLKKHKKALDNITQKTDRFHMVGDDVDLWITPGEERQWVCGSGRNIPSFEIFISPDWRGTDGWIRFNQPLYRHGVLIKDVKLWFEHGRVVKSRASKNQKVLHEMIAVENADKIGEFSLTDKRYSRITRFMATTLYDENVGGKYGNSHVALGTSFDDSWTGNAQNMTIARAQKLGLNKSAIHTDIITTTDRTVTAHLKDGTPKIIYQNGMYQV